MEINKDELRTWIAALRSGKYKQTTMNLQNSNGYCCLGVGCKVLIPEDKLKLNPSGFIAGGHPENQPHAPEWFKQINDDFAKKNKKSLVSLNDGDGFYFSQIADKLEQIYLSDGN